MENQLLAPVPLEFLAFPCRPASLVVRVRQSHDPCSQVLSIRANGEGLGPGLMDSTPDSLQHNPFTILFFFLFLFHFFFIPCAFWWKPLNPSPYSLYSLQMTHLNLIPYHFKVSLSSFSSPSFVGQINRVFSFKSRVNSLFGLSIPFPFTF